MKYFIAISTSLFSLCLALHSAANNTNSIDFGDVVTDTLPPKTEKTDTATGIILDGGFRIYDKVDIEASFPGGLNAWKQFLMSNLNANTPVNNGAAAGKYTVMVQFIVDQEGEISDLKALTKHGYGMEAEVIRLLKISPKWSPAQQNGKSVNAYRKQPITFVIQEEKKKKRRS